MRFHVLVLYFTTGQVKWLPSSVQYPGTSTRTQKYSSTSTTVLVYNRTQHFPKSAERVTKYFCVEDHPVLVFAWNTWNVFPNYKYTITVGRSCLRWF